MQMFLAYRYHLFRAESLHEDAPLTLGFYILEFGSQVSLALSSPHSESSLRLFIASETVVVTELYFAVERSGVGTANVACPAFSFAPDKVSELICSCGAARPTRIVGCSNGLTEDPSVAHALASSVTVSSWSIGSDGCSESARLSSSVSHYAFASLDSSVVEVPTASDLPLSRYNDGR